jgi:hypothetical protein
MAKIYERCAGMMNVKGTIGDDIGCQTDVPTLALLCVRYVGTSVVNLDPVDP